MRLAAVALVKHHKVRLAITIEIAHRHKYGRHAGHIGHRGLERAITVSEEYI
jgi:hypothetical protein